MLRRQPGGHEKQLVQFTRGVSMVHRYNWPVVHSAIKAALRCTTILCNAMQRCDSAMLCSAELCFAMLCYVELCYVVIYVTNTSKFLGQKIEASPDDFTGV